MPIISGHLKTMTTRTSAVAEVWVQSTEVMPRDTEVIVPETTKIPVDDGKVEFTAYPGRATIILVYMDSTPNAPIPIFITNEENQTIGDVITAGRDDEFQNPSEVENLIKQALEAVNRMQGTSDAAIAAAKEAKESQDAAKVSEDNAKGSEEAAAASAAQALGSQTAAKAHEESTSVLADKAGESADKASVSAGEAATHAENAKASQDAAKGSEDAAAGYWKQVQETGVPDGSVNEGKLSPELLEKINSGGSGAEYFEASFICTPNYPAGSTEKFVMVGGFQEHVGDEFPSWCGVAPDRGSLYLLEGVYTVSIFPIQKLRGLTEELEGSYIAGVKPLTIRCLTYPNWSDFNDHESGRIFTAQFDGYTRFKTPTEWYDERLRGGTPQANDASHTMRIKTRMNLHFSALVPEGSTTSLKVPLGISIVKHA